MGFGNGFSKPGGSGGVSSPAISLASTALSVGYDKILCVRKSGNDSTANGTVNKPFQTVQAALNYASTTHSDFSESVVVELGPGKYTENITISRHNTYIISELQRPEQRAVWIIGTITVNCSSASDKYNQIVGLQGLFITNSTANPTVKITGTAQHVTYVKDCYLASSNSNTAANCLLLDSTLAFANSKIVLENNTFLNQVAGPDVIKISGGDVNMDSNRVMTSAISGAGNGISQSGDSTVLCDRLQLDISTNGKCISIDSTRVTSPDSPVCYVSNSSLAVRGSSSAETIYTNRGLLAWNILLLGKTTAAINGSNTAGSYVMYNNLVSMLPGVAPTLNNFASAALKIKLSSI